jgi:hypothetical protein
MKTGMAMMTMLEAVMRGDLIAFTNCFLYIYITCLDFLLFVYCGVARELST